MFRTHHPDKCASRWNSESNSILASGRWRNGSDSPSLQAASRTARMLTRVEGFEVSSWEALVRVARPPPHEVDDYEPGEARHGLQHEAASRVERFFSSLLMERVAEHEQALLRSQSGPMAGMALPASPSNFLTPIAPHL